MLAVYLYRIYHVCQQDVEDIFKLNPTLLLIFFVVK